MTAQRSRKPGQPEVIRVGSVAVKIYRRVTPAGYERFEVADYSTGRRTLRGFSDYGEARTEAERVARLMASGETTAAGMRNFEAASYGRAVELLRPTGVSLEIACATFADNFTALGGNRISEAVRFFLTRNPDKLTSKTCAEVATELIDVRTKRGASKRYVEDLRSRLAAFSRTFQKNVADVRGPDLQSWFDGLSCAPRTLLNFRRAVGLLFSFAEQRGYILRGENPVATTEKVSGRTAAPVAIFTPEQIAKLLSVAPVDFVPVLALQAFAGLRSAEVERIDWQDIDLAGGFITVAAEKAKTRSRRLVPISANLRAWLAPYAQKTGRVWAHSHPYFYELQGRTAEAAGVEWKSNALRHSFISYRLAEIQDAAKVALEAGNSPAMIFANYRELVKPEQARTYFSIAPEQPGNVLSVANAINA